MHHSFMPKIYPPPWSHRTPVALAGAALGDSTSAGIRRFPEGMVIFRTRISGEDFKENIGDS